MAPASAAGLVAVFDYHKKKGYADLYSLHSWCGILVFALYFVQVSLAPARGGEEGSGPQVCHKGAQFSGCMFRGERAGQFSWMLPLEAELGIGLGL